MLRRKLFVYTVALSLGITVAFFIFYKKELLWGGIAAVSLIYSIWNLDLEYNSGVNKQRKLIFALFIIGIVLFAFKYASLNQNILDKNENDISYKDITCVVGEVKEVKEKTDGLEIIIDANNYKNIGKLKVSYYLELPNDIEFYDLLGSEVSVYGSIKLPATQENPWCFDYRLYLNSRNIRYTMSGKYLKINKTSNNIYWRYKRSVLRARESFLNMFNDEYSAFIKAVIFGDKSELSEELVDDFKTNSTGHILAVSGLHVGFLFALLRFLSGRRRSKLIFIIIIVILLLYAEMTNWSSSTIRAIIVAGISMLRIYSKHPFDLLSAVSTGALIILLINPYQLLNSGFQLSFLALLGLCFCTELMASLFGEIFAPILAIQLVITPMVAYSYSGFNILSSIINIPVVFLSSVLVPICIIGFMLVIVTGCAPAVLIMTTEGVSEIILEINSFMASDEVYYCDTCGFNVGLLLTYYVILFFGCSEWVRIKLIRKEYKRIFEAIKHIVIPLICVFIISMNPFLNDEIVFVAVGQGDCVHIRTETNNILIDGGGSEYFNVGKNTLKPYLLKNRVKKIDTALITHEHTDHFKGISELNEVYKIDSIGIPRICLEEENIFHFNNQFNIGFDDKIEIDEACYIEVVWPINNIIKSQNANEKNQIYIIHYGKYKILITGDILEADEKKMLEYYSGTDTLKCDILKIPHHGSKSSTSDELLDAVSPSIAIIQVGANNMYGHPHQETLDKLNARGIKCYRTDENGAIGVDLGKENIRIDTMN